MGRPFLNHPPDWATSVAINWKRICKNKIPALDKQGGLLKRGIRLLVETPSRPVKNPLSLPEQPFDAYLLNCSSLFRRSRKIYRDQGGKFVATLVSSPRTLSSSILLDQVIEYSPIEREMIWAALDPVESRNPSHLLTLRTYSSSLFHEQNHRILWSLLPSAPSTTAGLRRFLNLTESLVIILDMALGDQLGPELALLFYLTGVTYDPGTSIRSQLSTRRHYRNYLQAALHATYLNLELFNPREIPHVIEALFPSLGEFATRAAVRAGNLDRAFIQNTNLRWQKKNVKVLLERLCHKDRPTLELSDNPMDHYQSYLLAEKWFDLLGL